MDRGYMRDPGPDAVDDCDNPQYQREQIQISQAFPECDTPIVNPDMLSVNQNMFEQSVAQFAFHPVQHVPDGSWARAANPQLGPRDSNLHKPSVNTAPPFTSRPTTIPQREFHSENSANIHERFSNQFFGLGFSNGSAVPSPYSGQLVRSVSSLFSLSCQL